jgi:hypothetical protein
VALKRACLRLLLQCEILTDSIHCPLYFWFDRALTTNRTISKLFLLLQKLKKNFLHVSLVLFRQTVKTSPCKRFPKENWPLVRTCQVTGSTTTYRTSLALGFLSARWWLLRFWLKRRYPLRCYKEWVRLLNKACYCLRLINPRLSALPCHLDSRSKHKDRHVDLRVVLGHCVFSVVFRVGLLVFNNCFRVVKQFLLLNGLHPTFRLLVRTKFMHLNWR